MVLVQLAWAEVRGADTGEPTVCVCVCACVCVCVCVCKGRGCGGWDACMRARVCV